MTTEAINTVRIHAAHGRTEELGIQLADIVQNLGSVPGCISYVLSRDANDPDLWIVTGRWQSCETMAAYFAQTHGDGFNRLLGNRMVRSILFESTPTAGTSGT